MLTSLHLHKKSNYSVGHGIPGVVAWSCCGRIPLIGITSGILPFHFNSVEMNKIDTMWTTQALPLCKGKVTENTIIVKSPCLGILVLDVYLTSRFHVAMHLFSNSWQMTSKCKNKKVAIERFSNDCRKTKTKAITLTNHNRSRQRDEPITIPSNYPQLAQSAGKITRTWCDWFWFCFSLVEKLARVFSANH